MIVLLTLGAMAQKLERIVIKGGSNYWQSLSKEIYYYSTFLVGTIHYKSGASFEAPINYHKALDQIHIRHEEDTLAITNNVEIKYVVVNNDSFYYDNRFIVVVNATRHYKLGKQEKVRSANKGEKMAYRSIPNPGSSYESYTAFEINKHYRNSDGKKDFALIRQTIFFIGDKHNRFTKLTRKKILYMFPGKENKVNQYLTQNSVNLSDEESLGKLLQFLETLR